MQRVLLNDWYRHRRNEAVSGSPGMTDESANGNVAKQQIFAEIEQLRSELAGRRTLERPVPGSVVDAYRALIERQYDRLERLGLD
jgi:hypothetical protein